MFWRVELDKEGSIKSCELAEAVAKSGGKVAYIEADSKTNACLLAKLWYQSHLKRDRDRQKKVRAAKSASGECRECKAEAEPGKRHCKAHLSRANSRFHGETPGRLPIGVNVSIYQVLSKFDALGPDGFRAWVVNKISAKEAEVSLRESAVMAQAAE